MAVVIDQAPWHMTADVAIAARRMRMDLITVPPGSTGRRQPMDVRVFGVLKSKQSKLYDNAMRECPGRAWTKADSVRTIIDAWAEIGANVVKSGWRLARGDSV
jgi:hypothetical protein